MINTLRHIYSAENNLNVLIITLSLLDVYWSFTEITFEQDVKHICDEMRNEVTGKISFHFYH